MFVIFIFIFFIVCVCFTATFVRINMFVNIIAYFYVCIQVINVRLQIGL